MQGCLDVAVGFGERGEIWIKGPNVMKVRQVTHIYCFPFVSLVLCVGLY